MTPKGGPVDFGSSKVQFSWIISGVGPPAPVKQKVSKPFPKKENIRIKWQDAADHVGQYVFTDGAIVSTHNTGKVCFLNFHKDYKNHLTLVIFASDYNKFPESPEKYFFGKKIDVQGRVKLYNEQVEIIVRSMDQVKVLE